jgi:hypothetical protein
MDQVAEPVSSSRPVTETDSAIVDENTSLLPRNILPRGNKIQRSGSVISADIQDARIEEGGGGENQPEHSLRYVFGVVSVMLIGKS